MGVPNWDAHFLCEIPDSREGEILEAVRNALSAGKYRQKENRTGKPVLLKMFDFSN